MVQAKYLIVGHGRHGKDTVAELLGFKFSSSSWQIANLIYNSLKPKYNSVTECYDDRHNNRELWFNWITNYNTPDRCRLAREILSTNDCYVGMRRKEEFLATKRFFDLTIWVDATDRLPLEPLSSMTITRAMCDIVIDNNGSPRQLQIKCWRLKGCLNIK